VGCYIRDSLDVLHWYWLHMVTVSEACRKLARLSAIWT